MPTETEIKLRLEERHFQIEQKLVEMAYIPGEAVLEIDQIYDRDGELRRKRQLIRLRSRGTRTTLTYKGPPTEGRHKSREEIETDIEDGAAFALILQALGYVPTFRYEKRRTTFRAKGEAGIVTLDETPIGRFLELEGEGDWIDRTALELGFDPGEYITASYASLYQDHRARNPGVPGDMTF